MAKKNEKLSPNEVLVNKTEGWISTHRNVILISCIAVVAVVLIALIITLVSSKGSSKVDSALYTLTSDYDNFVILDADDENYQASLDKVVSEANALLEKPGVKKYQGAKAGLILAEIAFNDGNYEEASKLYKEVYEAQKNTYLGQVALISEAASVEASGDKSGALDLYNKVFDEYGVDSIYASRALFNAARLTEESDRELAISIYEQLVGAFEEGSSEYAKLAKTRISQLKVNN